MAQAEKKIESVIALLYGDLDSTRKKKVAVSAALDNVSTNDETSKLLEDRVRLGEREKIILEEINNRK